MMSITTPIEGEAGLSQRKPSQMWRNKEYEPKSVGKTNVVQRDNMANLTRMTGEFTKPTNEQEQCDQSTTADHPSRLQCKTN